MKKLLRKYVSLIKRIPERQYWPIFVILSLYFVVPMSEITVTVAALLYFKFEKRIRPAIGRLTGRLPDWIRYGGSFIFFLVMIDDTLFYFALIAVGLWSSRMVSKQTDTTPSQEGNEVLESKENNESHET
tara:strand:- start:349 stop:738 length:390 start_codon:yes stop_codon:yes gene_type:complete